QSRIRLLLQSLEERDVPAVFTVINTNDSGAGSFRQAVLDANNAAGADNVVFDPGVFNSPQTITLTSGNILVLDPVTIAGPGSSKLTLSGNKADRIFNFYSPSTIYPATVSGMTLTNGRTSTISEGGAIVDSGANLTLDDCVLTANQSPGVWGGAIYLDSSKTLSLNLHNCLVNNNYSNWSGPAICAITYPTNITID